MSKLITGFTFDDVNVDFTYADEHDVISINQGDDTIETPPDNMMQICIQYIALNNPDILK